MRLKWISGARQRRVELAATGQERSCITRRPVVVRLAE